MCEVSDPIPMAIFEIFPTCFAIWGGIVRILGEYCPDWIVGILLLGVAGWDFGFWILWILDFGGFYITGGGLGMGGYAGWYAYGFIYILCIDKHTQKSIKSYT